MKYRKVWLGGAIALTICAIGVAFAKPLNVANMLFRARAATYSGEKITFDRSNSTRSGTTNTTTGTTFTGGGIICKTYDNDTTQSNGYVGALKYGSSIRFYEPDGVTEYTFEDLDIIRFFYTDSFGFYLHVTYTDGEVKKLGLYSTSVTTSSGRPLSFKGVSYKDVANIWVECASTGDHVAQMTKIEIEYNCTSKHQTGVSVTTLPTKRSYVQGETFDPTGMVVKAQYSNSTAVATTSYSIYPTRALTTSDEYITITHNGFSTTVSISVTEEEEEIELSGTYATTDSSYYKFVFTSSTEGYYQRKTNTYDRRANFTYTLVDSALTLTLVSFTSTGSGANDLSDYANPLKPFYKGTVGFTNTTGNALSSNEFTIVLYHTTTSTGGDYDRTKSVAHTFTKVL